MNLYSKNIIGYAYGTSMTAKLVTRAVENVYLAVKNTKGIILHSDLGNQVQAIHLKIISYRKALSTPLLEKAILTTMPASNPSIQCLKARRSITINTMISMLQEKLLSNISNLGITEENSQCNRLHDASRDVRRHYINSIYG